MEQKMKAASKPAEAMANETFTTPFALAGSMGEAFTKACAEWQQEVARFTSRRLEGDMELMRSLSECRSVTEALRLQQSWAKDALQAYASETNQLMEIANRIAQQSVESLGSAKR